MRKKSLAMMRKVAIPLSSISTRLRGIKKRLENDAKHFNGGDANRSYCPQFVIFIMKYLEEMPLWSGVLVGRLDHYKEDSSRNKKETRDPVNKFLANAKSEGYIEGAMRRLWRNKKTLQEENDLELMHLYQKIILESEGVYVIMLTDYIVVFIPKRRERTKRNQTTKIATFQAQLRASVQKKRSTMMFKKNGVRKIQQFQQSPTVPLSATPDLKSKKVFDLRISVRNWNKTKALVHIVGKSLMRKIPEKEK